MTQRGYSKWQIVWYWKWAAIMKTFGTVWEGGGKCGLLYWPWAEQRVCACMVTWLVWVPPASYKMYPREQISRGIKLTWRGEAGVFLGMMDLNGSLGSDRKPKCLLTMPGNIGYVPPPLPGLDSQALCCEHGWRSPVSSSSESLSSGQ